MRVRHTSDIGAWIGNHEKHEIVAEGSIRVKKGSRLCAKVLVFKNRTAQRRFWRDWLSKPEIDMDTAGATCSMYRIRENPNTGRKVKEVDARYFAIISLVATHLTLEVVSHETCHAAFSYWKRRGLDGWSGAKDSPEEAVCYPMGRLMRAMTKFLAKEGLWK